MAFPDAHELVADLVEQLTDNVDLDQAREQPGYPEQAHAAAVAALYALRDQLAGITPDLPDTASICQCSDPEVVPLDIVEGTVECDVPPTGIDPDGNPTGHVPAGFTDIAFETQQPVGLVCTHCGRAAITRPTVTIAGARFTNLDLGR